MAEKSKIEWTDHTVNPWWGCAKVHTGCKNCYAETWSGRNMHDDTLLWGENAPRRAIKSAFPDLAKFQRQAAKEGIKAKVFIGSMMDIFEDSKPLLNPSENAKETGDLRKLLFDQITEGKYPNLVFLFLTKRPINIYHMIPREWRENYPPKNVWFGTSISNQETVNCIGHLYCNTPPKSNLFLSVEPQVSHVQLHSIEGIGWIIQGGESGSKKRPFDVEWARSMRDQCKQVGIPYFFKQIDKIQPIPSDLQIREFPEFKPLKTDKNDKFHAC